MTGFCNATTSICRNAHDEDYCQIGGVGWGTISSEIGETDVDCGGPGCARLGNLCNDTKMCNIGSDCQSGQCHNGICVSCSNGWKDGAETSIDCGGEKCGPCEDKKACFIDADCSSSSCDAGTCRSCSDGLQNGNETSVDCGGQTGCKRCNATGANRGCNEDSDCNSNRCLQNKCVSFFNGLNDVDESDVDCGGAAPQKCGDNKLCVNASDCLTGYCEIGISSKTCKDPPAEVHCANGERDIEYGETDIDCGGLRCSQNVSRCESGKMCAEARDCESGLCTLGWNMDDTTASSASLRCASCNDQELNGRESDTDCGGLEDVALAALYGSQVKTRIVQVIPGQFERRDDFAVAKTSTGGTSCARCADNMKCRVNSDCISGMCFPVVDTNFTGESPTLHKISGQSFELFGKSSQFLRAVSGDMYRRPIYVAVTSRGTEYVKLFESSDQTHDKLAQDTFCQRFAFDTPEMSQSSFCKDWQNPSVCHGSLVRCDINSILPGQLRCRSCNDNVRNGDESCIDAGGSHCRNQKRCADTKRCQYDNDCESGLCHHKVKRIIGGIADFGDPSAPGGLDDSEFAALQDGGYGGQFLENEGYGDGYGYSSGEAYEISDSTATLALSEEILLALTPGAEEEKFGVCVSCKNNIQDGSETGIDCGGKSCNKCANGQGCVADTDCLSSKCNVETRQCRALTVSELCNDGQKTASTRETDIDCGGACTPCVDEKNCLQDRDCESNNCHMNNITKESKCVSCYNNKIDGSETDEDCGGNDYFILTGNICGSSSGGACNVGCSRCCVDAFSPAMCNECVQNENRGSVAECIDYSVGQRLANVSTQSRCPRCADRKNCISASDCISSLCENGICVSCSDTIRNDHETCRDGGGSVCSRRCDDGETCDINSDCGSGSCFPVNASTSICVSCNNNKMDGNETCIDGGGSTCSRRCELGKGCKTGNDCQSGYCNMTSGVCRRSIPSEFCQNSILDQDRGEQCLDGGGPCASIGKRCGYLENCEVDQDCESSACYNNECVSCSEGGIKDGLETDVNW